MTTRHVGVLTGKRGGYGAMKPMLRRIEGDADMRLSLIVTDQHLNPAFGATISEVERDFEVAARVKMGQTGDAPLDRVQALGRCLCNMAEALAALAPDILILYGDRGEVLVSATAALHIGIPVAHVQGGDVSGNADDLMRHAVTKLSHIHFPSTQDSADRLCAMGEEPWRIHVVGDNHVDTIVAGNYTDEATLRLRYAIADSAAPILLLYHPETTRVRDHYGDMKNILQAVLERGERTLVIYPCSDHGYEGVVRAIEELPECPAISVHRNIAAPDFLGLMAIARVMVGNSSAGLIETPYFGLPAINIGERQIGRAHAENVIHCEAQPEDLAQALAMAMGDEAFRATARNCSRPFGDGEAGARIAEILRDVEIDARLMNKRLTF